MTFDQFLRILRARWKLALSIFLAVVIGTVIATLLFPKKYLATTTVLLDARPDAVSAQQAISPLSAMSFLATQIDLIESPAVARRVVSMLRLNENAAFRENWIEETKGKGDFESWLGELMSKGLKVKPSRESNVVEITYEGSNPVFSSAMANAFAKAYIDITVQFRTMPAKQYSDFFEERAKLAREKLEAAQQKLAAAQKEKGIVATEERLDVEMMRLTELSQQVLALRANRSDAESRSRESQRNPGATSEVLGNSLIASLKADADEGRSFLTKAGGKNRLGDKLFDERINVWADPWNPDVPVMPWDGNSGLARQRTDIIKNGRIASLEYSRYWAQKKGVKATAGHGNMIMAGGTKSLDELIADTKKGIVVTRTWYIRMVDPQTVLLTGLTRDGTFYVENGKIKHPVKNFRFNECPVTILNNIDELGKPEIIGGDEVPYQMVLPPMKVRDFNFTSLSDAV